jgi:hypothetical protein
MWNGMAENGEREGSQQWLLTVLPAFPLILLILRLWYLSGQDLQTMLMLVQYVSPLGLISTLLITLMWSAPVVILVARALGALLRASAPAGTDSWLVRLNIRIPDWVVVLVGLLAAFIWQLRFLPALLMLLLAILGLEVRARYGTRRRLVRSVCVVLPVVAAAAAYTWLAQAIVDAVRTGETLTALTLLLPPGLAVLFTGPIPEWLARPVTHWTALGGALLAPLVISAIFLRAPVLPTVALEIDEDPQDQKPATVLIGEVAAVDDTMTTMLDSRGGLQFVPNGQLRSKVLCPANGRPPYSQIHVHGWQVERTMLNWIAPRHPQDPPDPRCQGRSLILK